MSTPGKFEPEFTRRSETESICMGCFMTVRARRAELLEQEELNHTSACMGRADSPFRKPAKAEGG